MRAPKPSKTPTLTEIDSYEVEEIVDHEWKKKKVWR